VFSGEQGLSEAFLAFSGRQIPVESAVGPCHLWQLPYMTSAGTCVLWRCVWVDKCYVLTFGSSGVRSNEDSGDCHCRNFGV
jgi:hypothetical protein